MPRENITLVINQSLKAPISKVWKAWTDKGALESWFGPETFATTVHELDVREGGAYRLTMKSLDGNEHKVHGVYQEVAPQKKLVFTFQWESGDSSWDTEMLVTVEFAEKGNETEMKFIHERFPTEDSKINHTEGWESSFRNLEKHLSA